MLALRKRWGVPGRYVSVGALPRNTMSGFCAFFSSSPFFPSSCLTGPSCVGGHTMLQNDHIGKPLFVHANLLKQIPSGVGKGASSFSSSPLSYRSSSSHSDRLRLGSSPSTPHSSFYPFPPRRRRYDFESPRGGRPAYGRRRRLRYARKRWKRWHRDRSCARWSGRVEVEEEGCDGKGHSSRSFSSSPFRSSSMKLTRVLFAGLPRWMGQRSLQYVSPFLPSTL
jgi:hypothetical protein